MFLAGEGLEFIHLFKNGEGGGLGFRKKKQVAVDFTNR